MKSYSSREIIKILEKDGWFCVKCVGDHWQFKHHSKRGKVTITHPVKDIPKGTLINILKQADIKLESKG